MRRSRVALAAGALAAATACSGGGSSPHVASGSPTPAASASTPAGEALRALAATAAHASYRATYALAPAKSSLGKGVVTVARAEPSLRVDITTAGATTTLIETPRGSFSCRRKGAAKTCFLVAGAGKPVPALFDAGLQRVFSTSLDALAVNIDAYDVTPAPGTPAAGAVPAGACFDVTAHASPATQKVAPGRYCLADAGVVTAVTFPTGSLRLTAYVASSPPTTQFTPYSSPTPLPS